ncbi:QRFP-like peptide receptor [Anneissia japonica]|uniref:QRFP-like peptide receptor n=1 Tax=Anneissia japonica TaxID=1529436 RepID=UPI0014259C62|nr:QRFP-like peptide receptor [Anneissia japonica]
MNPYLAMLFLEFQSHVCSTLTIATISFERCYVLRYPLRVRTLFTLKRMLIVTAIIWVISILCATHVLHNDYRYVLILNGEFDEWKPITHFITPAVILIVFYVITSVTLIRAIHSTSNRLQESNQSKEFTHPILRNQKKILIKMTIVAVVSLCMTSPNTICRYLLIAEFNKKKQFAY